jgi:hypothetical protein
MLELKAATIRRKIDLNPDICRRFKDPIVFYLAHKNDHRCFFITFAVLNLKEKEILYVITYLPENIEKVKNHKNQQKYRAIPCKNTHCSVKVGNGGGFISFPEDGKYFYRVFPGENRVEVHSGEDLVRENKDFEFSEFGSTPHKVEENGNSFLYFTAIDRRARNHPTLNYFRAKPDMSEIRKIFSAPVSRHRQNPHTTKKYGPYLISSDFTSRRYKNKKTGLVYETLGELIGFAYKELYGDYCKSKREKFSKEDFFKKNLTCDEEITLERDFQSFCENKNKNFLDLCFSSSRFDFSISPGEISIIDPEKQTIKSLKTTFCEPAHFEIDYQKEAIYAFSHNFSRLDGIHYFGPAAIDKFSLKDEYFEKVESFVNPTGYRMTDCKMFYYQNKPYLCSIGRPNRLFFISADTMSLLFHDDIGEDMLSKQKDTRHFLNHNDTEPFALRALEVSDDGELVFLLSHQHIYFYSFSERRLLTGLRYRDRIPILDGNSTLGDFYQRTSHCSCLR